MPQHHRGNLIEMIKKSVTAKDYCSCFPEIVIEPKSKSNLDDTIEAFKVFIRVCLFMPCIYLIQGMRFYFSFKGRDLIITARLNAQDIKKISAAQYTKFQGMKRIIEK